MHIAGKPGQMVFQAKHGGDKFLVFDTVTGVLHIYVVVDKLLCPSMAAVDEYEERPYLWHDATGMMYILREHAKADVREISSVEEAESVLESLEEGLQIV